MAALIGLPPKMAEFFHTCNRLLVGRRRRRALLRLYFNSSVVSWLVGWLVVDGWSVHNEGSRALGGFPPKGKWVLSLVKVRFQVCYFWVHFSKIALFQPAKVT